MDTWLGISGQNHRTSLDNIVGVVIISEQGIIPTVDGHNAQPSDQGTHRQFRLPGRSRRITAPVSITYTLILLGTNIFQQVAPAGTRSRVLLDASTNLHNLLHGRFDTLITSITFIDYLPWEVLVMLPCMLIPVEIRLGSRRLAATYLLGNVGATTVVAIELYVGFRAGWLHNAATMTTEDVGVSYGAMATVGLLTVLFAPVLRKWWAAGWLVFAAVQMLGRREYFTIGHVLALLIGLGVSYLTVRTYHKDGTEYPAFSRTGQALFFVPTTVLGICLLI